MANPRQHRNWIFGAEPSATIAALTFAIVVALTFAAPQSAQAQTFTVLHTFSGADGALPDGSISMDSAGNLYGTTSAGGSNYGTVYKLKHTGGGWVITPLYKFTGGSDGGEPYTGVILGPDHTLYGATYAGGQGTCNVYGIPGCGVVFNLKPSPTAPRSALQPWIETPLYSFTGGSDGADQSGGLVFDQSGAIYGETEFGGSKASPCDSRGCGVVYRLTGSGSNWTQTVLYSFTNGSDGSRPISLGGMIFDNTGNLYGTTYGDLGNTGSVFELTPSGGSWIEKTLYTFQNKTDGEKPNGGVIFDQSGNLYGTAFWGGSGNGGTVFQLTPSGGGWSFNLLYSLSGPNESGPCASLLRDNAGNLYGTTWADGLYNKGNVFKLTPSGSGWTYTDLYDFTGGKDGGTPCGTLIFDSNGNLFGTAETGGTNNDGVVWEITP